MLAHKHDRRDINNLDCFSRSQVTIIAHMMKPYNEELETRGNLIEYFEFLHRSKLNFLGNFVTKTVNI